MEKKPTGPKASEPRPSTWDRGLEAEALALRHLEERGCVLVERNFRWRGGEIDLVVLDGQTIVFVEVRSAHGSSSWLRHSISPVKRRRLQATVARYRLARHWARLRPLRFDLAWVEGGVVEVWKNVFLH